MNIDIRKRIFRGFHPNKNGETTIYFDGMTFKGEWRYWDEFARRLDESGKFIFNIDGDICKVEPCDVLGETIGEWVITYNNKNVFVDDTIMYNDEIYTVHFGEFTDYNSDDKFIGFYLEGKNNKEVICLSAGQLIEYPNSEATVGNSWEVR